MTPLAPSGVLTRGREPWRAKVDMAKAPRGVDCAPGLMGVATPDKWEESRLDLDAISTWERDAEGGVSQVSEAAGEEVRCDLALP